MTTIRAGACSIISYSATGDDGGMKEKRFQKTAN